MASAALHVSEAVSLLNEASDSGEIPGAAIAVAVGGEPVLETAFGFSDRAGGVRTSPDTPFSLASVTKPMVGTAVALLAHEGLIDLDAPVSHYWPGPVMPFDYGQEPTVRQLANHTAGLPEFARFIAAGESTEQHETLHAYARAVFPPGSRYVYSNLGFGLLGAILEQVSGRRLADVLAELVFQPLKMASAGVGGPGSIPGAAVRYTPAGSAYPAYATSHPGASDGWCGVRDLLQFGLAHLGAASGLPGSVRAACHLPTAPWSRSMSYGIGWVVRHQGPHRVIFHQGGMPGVTSQLTVVPEADVVVAAASNTQTSVLEEVTHRVLSALLPGYGPPPPGDGRFDAGRPPVSTAAVTGAWAGTVALRSGAIPVTLDINDGTADLLAWDGGHKQPVTDLRVTDASAAAQLEGSVPAAELGQRLHTASLVLHRARTESLTGVLTASVQLPPGAAECADTLAWPIVLQRA
ncbi:serine hydrolase domain-containing protein [Streptomyces sp. NPDC102381]|uniref:serine hydrolase domain-containing protein n=1 Tax=Streptomyces sp. NPDC102381 TaxID=3366164 RepID=UPI00380DC2D4